MKLRASILFGIICTVFTALYLWLAYLATTPTLAVTATNQSVRSIDIPAPRGVIYDHNLIPLTGVAEGIYTAYVIPTAESIALLAPHTTLTEEELSDYLSEGKLFTCEVDIPAINSDKICIFPSATRTQSLASHIIGYTDQSGQGVAGIELAYDEQLHTPSYQLRYSVDAMGKALSFVEIPTVATPTEGVVLTLDRDLQQLVEQVGQELDSGAIVVMEVATGKLRALASFPSYETAAVATALHAENSPLLNRTLTPYAVGSVFKVMTTAASLTQETAFPTDFSCDGQVDVHGLTFHCHDREGHGALTLTEAMAYSCNPYFITLGQSLAIEPLLQVTSDCGFGKHVTLAPGIVSSAGVLPTVSELSSPAGLANFSFGQGTFSATPITLAQMMATVAGNGDCPTPLLIEGMTDGEVVPTASSVTAPALSPTVAETLQNLLWEALVVADSTALPAYTSAGGKTSTAQTGRYVAGEELLNGWFVGYFPADDPTYVVSVVVESATSGSADAAPLFRAIADGFMLHESR